jgi:hypothetical protein
MQVLILRADAVLQYPETDSLRVEMRQGRKFQNLFANQNE